MVFILSIQEIKTIVGINSNGYIFQILNPSIDIEKGKTKTLGFLPTVPILCSNALGNCEIELEVTYPGQQDTGCKNFDPNGDIVFKTSSCGVRMKGILRNADWKTEWDNLEKEIRHLNVTAVVNKRYGNKRMALKLRTGVFFSHRIWSNYYLPDIQVMSK